MSCQRCEIEKLNDTVETFYRVLAKIVPVMGLTTTERRVEPARDESIKELSELVRRRDKHECTHPQPGRPPNTPNKKKK